MKARESIYNKKIAGILAPLFALRGTDDLGIGDTAALCEMITWAAQHGFKALQMLPINETSSSHSPYEILSTMALEPSTITTHPNWLPDLSQEDYHDILKRYDIQSMQQGGVQYALVKSCKQELLTAAYTRFEQRKMNEERIQEYYSFQKQESYWLADYTLYRALLEYHGNQEDFSTWKRGTRYASSARRWLKTLLEKKRLHIEKRRDFFSYVQWIAITQWKKVFLTAEALGVSLIGDVPIGVHIASADVFGKPELFDTQQFGGAPPEKVFQSDPFTMQWGQNWGIPLYKWDCMEKDNFQWWRHRIRFLRSFFHFLRIDHTLGLFRIYSFPWPPQRNSEFLSLSHTEALKKTKGILPHFVAHPDDTKEHAAYNQERGKRLLRLFQEEAGEHHLIAEDLGEVPSYIPTVLEKLEIPGFKIPLWVRNEEEKMIPASLYPTISIATYATHDHPPVRKQWERWQHEITERHSAIEDQEKAENIIRELLHYIGLPHVASLTPYRGKVHQGFLKTLYESRSWLAMVMITDLFGLTTTFNKPGDQSTSNWVERIPFPITTWNKKHAAILAFSDQQLHKSGRFYS